MTDAESHDAPMDKFVYRHTGTDDEVQYLGRGSDTYRFSINGGARTMKLPTGDWPVYREYLEVDRHV